jgi:uncharacterized Zn finger protein
MSRENSAAKAIRYLEQARVRILECHEDAGTLAAEVRGNGAIYVVAYDADGWRCTCPALGENCSHVLACKAVTVFEPRESPAWT